MVRSLVAAVVLVAASGWAGPGWSAEAGPDAVAVRRAAESYDEGVRAWRAGQFAAAACHFEAADEAVPSVVSLSEAIKSRRKAKHGARAATLAALALRRHPEDTRLSQLAHEVITELGPTNHRLEVRCSTPCMLAVGTRVIIGPATRQAVLYVEPGQQTVSANFPDSAEAAQQVIVATAGGRNSIYLRPPTGEPPPPVSPAGPKPVASVEPSSTTPVSSSEPAGGASPPEDGTAAVAPADDSAIEPWQGLSPAWFFVGLGTTAVLGAVTVWSGVDTVSNPGEDAVRTGCVGLGTDCPEYQEGLDKETRTNALIGVTASVAGITALLGLLTDWSFDGAGGSSTAGVMWRVGPGTLEWTTSF
jgi:hypothetical protein